MARIEHPKVKGKKNIIYDCPVLDETTHYDTIFEETGSGGTNGGGGAWDIQVDRMNPSLPSTRSNIRS